MRQKNNKVVILIGVFLVVVGALYVACKDVTPKIETVENNIELKLGK
ncbi:MAG: hypothetical protein IKW58_02940 [Alphaproteobacteria bacterium]|nr:hypothetical protein [Alphaproteobacteria bacterium]